MQTETRSLSDKIFLVLKGLAMGTANKVPGVSGGVIAFVAGFYEEFIYSMQRLNGKAFRLLIRGRFTEFWIHINGKFLGLLILGMLISYFSVSLLLDLALQHYPLLVWSSFFGMIIGSIYYIARDYDAWNKRNVLFLILGTVAGIGISLLEPAQENDQLLFVFFCGVVGVSGMTLPGLSGSFLLILFGNYVLLLVDAVNALYVTMLDIATLDFAFIDNIERIRLLKVLGVFALGSITGLITLSHFLGYLLRCYKNATNAVIIGFIAGSLGVVWPWKNEMYQLDTSGTIMIDKNGNPILDNYDRFIPTEFGLIGKNIDYSFSRSYFRDKFDVLGINDLYENFDCATIQEVLEILKETNISGYNVTIPFKERVFSYLDHIDADAKKIGAINTIKRTRNDELIGFNTDFLGFTGALYEKLDINYEPQDLIDSSLVSNKEHPFFENCKALILGTGGASKAIVYALDKIGVSCTLVSRKQGYLTNHLTYSDIDQTIIASHNLIVNTTPLGTFPEILACPDIPYQHLTKEHFLFDLVYNPSETQFLKRGKEQDAIVTNGLRMLELQAEFAWELWNA